MKDIPENTKIMERILEKGSKSLEKLFVEYYTTNILDLDLTKLPSLTTLTMVVECKFHSISSNIFTMLNRLENVDLFGTGIKYLNGNSLVFNQQ